MMARDSYTCIARSDRRAGLPIGWVLDDSAPVPSNQLVACRVSLGAVGEVVNMRT